MTDGPGTRPTMTSAKAPSSAGPVAGAGVVLALIAVVLGVVGVRDALVSTGAVGGRSWIERGIDGADGYQAQWWMVPVGGLLALLGLWLLVTAVRPRSRKAASMHSSTGVFISPRDLRLLARNAAEDVDGVIDADARASRSVIRITATVTAKDEAIDDDIVTSVTEKLSCLDPAPQIRVRTASRELS